MATSEKSSSSDYLYGSQEVNMKESDHVNHFSKDEEDLVVRMYNLVGERWALIAGRIPGRNAEEIEKYWVSRLAIGFGK